MMIDDGSDYMICHISTFLPLNKLLAIVPHGAMALVTLLLSSLLA